MDKLCDNRFKFIAKIFCYINKIKNKETNLNFEVIIELLKDWLTNNTFDSFNYDNEFCFVKFLIIKIKSFFESGRILRESSI